MIKQRVLSKVVHGQVQNTGGQIFCGTCPTS